MNRTKSIGQIFLTWRSGKGGRRKIVGVIKKNISDGVVFKYSISEEESKKIGFIPYVDFPNLTETYKDNVLETFGLRLTKSERPDIQNYYDFWEISPEYQNDKYYLLAHTQGLLATDNFEFVADYNPVKGLAFVSEICGLSHYNPPVDSIEIGDTLRWEREENNFEDKTAVKLFKGEILLGYVKQIHCRIFSKTSNLNVIVKSIERNGSLHRVFIKISL